MRLPSSCFEVDGYRNRTKLLLWPTRNDCLCQTMVTGGRGAASMTQHTMLHRWRRCARRKKVVEAENNNLRKIHVCLMEFVANHRINSETMMGFRRWRCDLKILSHSSSPWKLGGIACPAPHFCMSYRGTNARPPNGMRTDLGHTSFNVKR